MLFNLIVLLKADDTNATCGTPDYVRVLYPEDSAISYTLTQSGALKFIRCGLDSAIIFAMQIPFPDITVPVNLGITSLEFTLKDIAFSDFTVGRIDAIFEEGVPVQAGIEDTNVHLVLAWSYTETVWPYAHDEGTGEIILNGIVAKFSINTGCDYEVCPGHLKIDLQQAMLTFDRLSVRLEGGSSWIYQSMINLLIEAIREPLCAMISDLLLNGATELMNQMMTSSGYYWPYAKYPDVIKDDRFVAGIQVRTGYIIILYSGYTYKTDQLQDEYITRDMLQPITHNYFNYQLGFQIRRVGFDNAFYIFHKYHDAYSIPGLLKVSKAPTVEFYNAAALFHVSGEVSGVDGPVDLKMVAKPLWRTDKVIDPATNYRNVTQVFFTLQPHESSKPVPKETFTAICEQLNAILEHANYQIDTTPFMIMEDFNYVIDSKQELLRLYANEPEECPKL